MNVFVITACYNFSGKLEKYIESFNEAFNHSDATKISFRFMFVNDQPGTSKQMNEIVKSLVKSPRVKYSIHNNTKNVGVTLSRNWAARAIYRVFGNQISPDDIIIYFDCDDIWDIESVNILDSLRDCKSEFIFLPVDVSTIPINKEIAGEMELGKFCTYVPLQECIYCWRVSYAYRFLKHFGFLWYEDKNECKYYPEDMMFHLNPKHKCLVLPDAVICHRNYETGNIAHCWDDTIRKNIPAFRTLVEMHRINMHRYEYSAELIKYVNYLSSIVYEDSDNK